MHMMMLAQCVNFQAMAIKFFERFRASGLTDAECDFREVTDMVEWQALVATIEVKADASGIPTPFFEKGFSLATIVSAHHNLVIYGVPWASGDGLWTNPGPKKRFYAPGDAILQLAKSDPLINDAIVQAYLLDRTSESFDLKPAEVLPGAYGYPGMKDWVTQVGNINLEPHLNSPAWQKWNEWHGGNIVTQISD